LNLEYGADRLSRKVGTELPLNANSEECRAHLHRGGNLKSRKNKEFFKQVRNY
jgi:hypothetical protein